MSNEAGTEAKDKAKSEAKDKAEAKAKVKIASKAQAEKIAKAKKLLEAEEQADLERQKQAREVIFNCNPKYKGVYYKKGLTCPNEILSEMKKLGFVGDK